MITPDTDGNYLAFHFTGKLCLIVKFPKSKEDVMKKLIKLAIAGVLVATSLSACIVVPVGPPHGGYYRHDPYYGR